MLPPLVEKLLVCNILYTNTLERKYIWKRFHMDTLPALLSFCEGNSLDTVDFPNTDPDLLKFIIILYRGHDAYGTVIKKKKILVNKYV